MIMDVREKRIKNALISVFDKTNLVKLAQVLYKKKIKIFATKNTKDFLKKKNISVTSISDITKYEEILNHQIKTIHPKIFAGILGDINNDIASIKKYNIILFDLIIINFYPFNNINYNQNLEKDIDIGGPAIVRAAAKNYKNTTIITNIQDYDNIIKEIDEVGYISIKKRLQFAQKAFEYTTNYDFKIFQYFNKKIHKYKNTNNIFPEILYIKYHKKQHLRYGENPDQKAALYLKHKKKDCGSIDSLNQVNGIELSYNNIYDAHIAYECVKQFTNSACVIVKHGNPCGASISDNLKQAYLNAYYCNPISAFGGVISFNQIIDTETILTITKQQFVDVIVGPDITDHAAETIKKYPKVKLLILGYSKNIITENKEMRTINNSLLVQTKNHACEDNKNWIVVSEKIPTIIEKKYAIFCWKIAKFVKSNAIVYSYKFNTIGIGSGQTNRLEAVKIANSEYKKNESQFNLQNKKIIVASDAFFPFRDSIDECIKNKNISCIIQPGGSIRDKEVIEAVNHYKISMIFTNKRNFQH